ncbi:hypothetical protein Patl1_30305 [Pistacia atlantica]|uniref:Uncharacterized protein n=1 Tax=Pistacia atlantica TaxID=434234 RepID=A0ACC1AC99_9ROSI|nr:hypothetical protein Patl1_30305 [Pistacia atlantica]
MEHLKGFLLKHFRMKDLGNLKYFLGIEFSVKERNFHVLKKICTRCVRRFRTSWCTPKQFSDGIEFEAYSHGWISAE